MEMPKFNSVEEVKEFISNNNADALQLGIIHFVDENGKSTQMTMNDFINKVGLDTAAEFIYATKDKIEATGFDGDELKEVMEKFKNNPDSLTDKEKMMLQVFAEAKIMSEEPYYNLINLIIKSFTDTRTSIPRVTDNYSGILAVFLTILENLLVMNAPSLSAYSVNRIPYEEIVSNVSKQIVLPDVDESILLATLFNIIGTRFVGSSDFKSMKLDYRGFAELLGLDTEFLFDEEVKTDSEDIKNILKNITNDTSTNTENNIVNLDIRKTLKNDKR